MTNHFNVLFVSVSRRFAVYDHVILNLTTSRKNLRVAIESEVILKVTRAVYIR